MFPTALCARIARTAMRAAPLVVLIGLLAAPLDNAKAIEVIGDGAAQLDLEVSKGRLVRLDRPAHTVFIADPEIADIQVKSPSLVYVLGKKPGETTLFAVDQRENVLANLKVRVSHNLSRLREAVDTLVPNENIDIASVDGSLVLQGNVESPADAENVHRLAERFAPEEGQIINRLTVDTPHQVNIRVRIAEVSRDIDKQFGFRWDLVGKIGGMAIGLATFNPFNVEVTPEVLGASVNPGGGNWDINVLVDALEDEGLVKILAEPNLTAANGETASFLAGGEFPIIVPQSQTSASIQFKKFGISLDFTPTIVNDHQISIHVRPEVSQLTNTGSVKINGFQVPGLTTRRAETTVDLAPGQSFAIAGLLRNDVTHDIDKFPGLGDVPILGALFKSDRFQRQESELVIIVTPYLVRPSKQRLAAPTDGFEPPHDVERLFPGGTTKMKPTAGASKTIDRNGRTIIGAAGFQLD